MDIEIEFISGEIIRPMNTDEKVEYILGRISKNTLLVVEESLTLQEETRLIEATMEKIDDKFSGVEISTLRSKDRSGLVKRAIHLLGGTTGGLTIIGPSKLVKSIKKEPQKIMVLAGGVAGAGGKSKSKDSSNKSKSSGGKSSPGDEGTKASSGNSSIVDSHEDFGIDVPSDDLEAGYYPEVGGGSSRRNVGADIPSNQFDEIRKNE